jgi:hypothetical protein
MKAFPKSSNQYQTGMELRDYFAAHAMQALLARSTYHVEDAPSDLADESYVYADAMMKMREAR